MKELEKINSAAYGTYESDYFFRLSQPIYNVETILMLPTLRKNTDTEISDIPIKSNNKFHFQLPLYSQEHFYPISYISFNLPSILEV
jgi:hypothetical protein